MHNRHRARSLVVVATSLLALASAGACKKSSSSSSSPGASSQVTAARAPNSLKVDKVCGEGGPIKTDSTPDAAINVIVDGPITSLALITVNEKGEHIDSQMWDTLAEGEVPAAWHTTFKDGGDTWQLGVEENGRMLNDAKGALTPLPAGRHNLTLWAADSGYFGTGTAMFMVLGERPDHGIVKSNIFRMQ